MTKKIICQFLTPKTPVKIGAWAIVGLLMWLLVGCSGLFNGTNRSSLATYTHDETTNRNPVSITLDQTGDQFAHAVTNTGSASITLDLTVDTGSNNAWRIYFILSNGDGAITSTPKVTTRSLPSGATDGPRISASQHVDSSHSLSIHSEEAHAYPAGFRPEHIDREKYGLNNLPSLIPVSQHKESSPTLSNAINNVANLDPLLSPNMGDTRDIYAPVENKNYTATARLVQEVGSKTLIVWTAPNVYTGCSSNCINALLDSNDISAIGNTFLKSGSNNDIHDWVTALTGAEWGNHSHPNLISASTSTINILMHDIQEDKEYGGGIVGYYWAGNNFKKSAISSSNQMLLFYMDAPLAKYWNSDQSITNARRPIWRHIVYSTLAHEFQHMVNFYQRSVVLNESDPAWLNEQFSLVIEDMVAQRLFPNNAQSQGLQDDRGLATPGAGSYPICGGRAYTFAQVPYWGVSRWDNSLINYAINFAMGSYLIRNYPISGSTFFQRAYGTRENDIQTLLKAAQASESGLTEHQLIARWGMATLLSDDSNETARYRYNYGSSGLSSGGITLGSINVYNYGRTASGACATSASDAVPALRVFRSTRDIYYQLRNQHFGHSFFPLAAAQNVTGQAVFKVTLPRNGSLAVIAKRDETTGPSFFPSSE